MPGLLLAGLKEVDALDVATAPMSDHALIREALLRGKHVRRGAPLQPATNQWHAVEQAGCLLIDALKA